jgi:putative hydrolase of the HAD superfamily
LLSTTKMNVIFWCPDLTMKAYKHIFFDLDRTLWDFDSNSAQTLLEIIEVFGLEKKVANSEKWLQAYNTHNSNVWKLYEENKINKANLRIERFRLLFNDFNIDDVELLSQVSEYYIASSPLKKALMPGAKELLEYLSDKYKLHIISNGFYDAQRLKLQSSEIDVYFDRVITSDKVGAAKPDKRIFEEAVKSINARKRESVFVGDNLENDFLGAMKSGIDQIWYNHDKVITEYKPTYEISSLNEIILIL